MVAQDPFGLRGRQAATAAEGVQLLQGRAGPTDAVLLDRVDDVAQADTPYCVHGQATCVRCGQWCWLGDRSYAVVSAGQAAPLCRPCGRVLVPAGSPRAGNVADHRRTDGPH